MLTHIRGFSYFMMVILAVFFGSGVTQSRASTSGEMLVDEENIKVTINEYFTMRYESRLAKTSTDFSTLAVPAESKAQAWIQLELDRQEIEIFIAKTFQVDYLNYEFYLDYEEIQLSGIDAIVKVKESNKLYYLSDPSSPSEIKNLVHTIILQKIDGQWKILDDQYKDETIRLVESLPMEEIKDNIQKNHDDQFQLNVFNDQTPKVDPIQPLLTTYPYDGQAVIDYTYMWWDSINPTYHDEPGNDCTNFASQAIYNGTSNTMSSTRDYWTDWYYDFYSQSGSYPWINVDGIYTFLTSNSGVGPYGYSSGSYLCFLSKGDIITMKQDDVWEHTVIVRSITECHDPSQVRVDAHDTDSYNRPLSDYSGFVWYAIDITGYRK